MSKDGLRYDKMVERALRGVVREAISLAIADGLPGSHHFYITFKTAAACVEIGDHLRARYPDEMTIVIEHQFWELTVTEEAFAVTLSFSNRPERLTIPFAAITAFADPSVKFGLQFQQTPPSESATEAAPPSGGEQVLRLAEAPGSADTPRARQEGATPQLIAEKPTADTAKPTPAKAGAKKPGEVVTLDTFRKK